MKPVTTDGGFMARKKKAKRKAGKVMHEYKHGSLKSSRSGRKVKSRKQAIAIAMSESGQSRKRKRKKS
jgi:hypothetical protein